MEGGYTQMHHTVLRIVLVFYVLRNVLVLQTIVPAVLISFSFKSDVLKNNVDNW